MSTAHASPGTPALFLADAAGLDFLNSIATPDDRPVEWLGDGAGLIAWLRQAGLAADAPLDEIAAHALPGELDHVAEQARQLREWFRHFVRMHMGRPLEAGVLPALAPINRLLERDETYSRIVATDEGALTLGMARRWRTPEALLIPIAQAMARVVTEEDFSAIRNCEGHGCTLLFADHTRGRARRWCSMSVCGNRAKAAAHRQRQRQRSAT
jgi:predicted RNA-binding Zn ribbon-like protein